MDAQRGVALRMRGNRNERSGTVAGERWARHYVSRSEALDVISRRGDNLALPRCVAEDPDEWAGVVNPSREFVAAFYRAATDVLENEIAEEMIFAGIPHEGLWVTSLDRAWIRPERAAEAVAWLRERGVRPRKGKFKSRELGRALRRLGVDFADDPVLWSDGALFEIDSRLRVSRKTHNPGRRLVARSDPGYNQRN